MKEATRHPIKTVSRYLMAIVILSITPALSAAEYVVEMTSDWTFEPDYLEMQVGDTVIWVNHDYTFNYHNTVCPGYWSSGYLDVDDSVSLTIPIAGTFYYRDSNFYIVGMTGTIVVKDATPVEPTAATLTDPVRLESGAFQFSVSNLVVGATYIVQASSNLVDWSNISTNAAASTVETYVDNAAPVGPRYYRTCHLR